MLTFIFQHFTVYDLIKIHVLLWNCAFRMIKFNIITYMLYTRRHIDFNETDIKTVLIMLTGPWVNFK